MTNEHTRVQEKLHDNFETDYTFSGRVFTVTSSADFSKLKFDYGNGNFYAVDKDGKEDKTNFIIAGDEKGSYLGAGGNTNFWANVWTNDGASIGGDNRVWGHTLRIDAGGGAFDINIEFSPVVLGGLIVQGTGADWVNLHSANPRELNLVAVDDEVGVKFRITKNTEIRRDSGDSATCNVHSNSEWWVWGGYQFQWRRYNIFVKPAKTLTLSRISGSGNAEIRIMDNGKLELQTSNGTGAKLQVNESVRLTLDDADLVAYRRSEVTNDGIIMLRTLYSAQAGADNFTYVGGKGTYSFKDGASTKAAILNTWYVRDTPTFENNAVLGRPGNAFLMSIQKGATLTWKGDLTLEVAEMNDVAQIAGGDAGTGTINFTGAVTLQGPNTLQLNLSNGNYATVNFGNGLTLAEGAVLHNAGKGLVVKKSLTFAGGVYTSPAANQGVLTLEDVAVHGEGEIANGQVVGRGSVSVASGSTLVLTTSGDKKFASGLNLAAADSSLIVKNVDNWQDGGAVFGAGTLTLDLENASAWFGSADYSLQGSAGRMLGSTAGLENMTLSAGTVLNVSEKDVDKVAAPRYATVRHLVVEEGAAFVLRMSDGDKLGTAAATLVLNGETTLAGAQASQVAANGGSYTGALLVGADASDTSAGMTYHYNGGLALGSDATVLTAAGVGNDAPGYTLELGSGNGAGVLQADGHVLAKKGAGTLVLAEHFNTAGDTGTIRVDAGRLEFRFNGSGDAASPLAGYDVAVGAAASLMLRANATNPTQTYGIHRLSGSGTLAADTRDGVEVPDLAIANSDVTEGLLGENVFSGKLEQNGKTMTVRMTSGYQKFVPQLSGALRVEMDGGYLDLTGITDRRQSDSSLYVSINDSSAKVDGLELLDGDTLNLNGLSARFNVTMRGGAFTNAEAFRGIIYLDDGMNRGQQEFVLENIGNDARVSIRALHAGDKSTSYITTNAAALKLSGRSVLTLGSWLAEGHGGFDSMGYFNLLQEEGRVVLDKGASLVVSVANVIDDIVSAGADGVLYRISNHSIREFGSGLSFGAELALFNFTAELAEETGCIRFRPIEISRENVYQASENNEGGSSEWNTEGGNVYESTNRFVAVYIDRSTVIDLRDAPMGTHDDGLVLKNLMGNDRGTLTVEGDGAGVSKITLSNNISQDKLDKLAEEMGVEVQNMLSYYGDITLTNTDFQVKHIQAESVTQMHGVLTLHGEGGVEMTSGVLELTSRDNDLGCGGMAFVGNEGQLILNGATATLGGDLTVADAGEPTVLRDEHILMLAESQLDLRDASTLGAGLLIGRAEAAEAGHINGTLRILGGVAAEAGVGIENVVLHLAEDSHLSVGGAVDARAVAEADGAPEWQLAGLTGSGALSSAVAQNITLAVARESCTFSGDLSGFNGRIVVAASPYTQTFSGVSGGAGVSLSNAKGGKLVLDLMGARASGLLELGGLTLASGSETQILMDLGHVDGHAVDSGLQMGSLVTQSGAAVTVGHYSGSVLMEAGEDGRAEICLGHADVAQEGTLNWKLQGIRNVKNNDYTLRVENGYLYASVLVEQANKWLEFAESGNAQAGASMLWGVKDSGSVGGDLAALDSAVSRLLDGDNRLIPGNVAKANRILAAAAGASTAVINQAFAGDIDRQLRAIRNRTTSMGYRDTTDAPLSSELPRWSAWVNAEGNFSKQDADGLMPGYKINGWGGTLGVLADTSTATTVGLALTAMYNDLESDGPDKLKSDMDNYYVSAFARVADGAWLHTFVASLGMTQVDGHRSVNYGEGSYTTDFSTQGIGLGLMYELGYGMILDQQGTLCLQPVFNVMWRMARLDGYSENGSTAALQVENQTYNTVTFGMGARMQAVVGHRALNNSTLLEARALLKVDVGDRRGENGVAFRYAREGRSCVKGAERGVAGLELGAGLSVPLGIDAGEVFADASAELRSNATELNVTVGYKVSF